MAFLRSWSWESDVLAGLAIAAGLYVYGWQRLRRRDRGRLVSPAWRTWCYGGGLAALGLAFLSPIALYSSLFFCMHMVQHLLLVMVIPPLLWLGAPLVPTLWALPRELRRGIGWLFVPGHPVRRLFETLTRPVVATLLHLAAVGLWHVPVLYDAAQGRTAIHDLEHLLFLGTALLYWWSVLHPVRSRRLSGGLAILYFLAPMIEGELIGALLTFAGEPIYATYRAVPRVWGLSALDDQRLGGLIMWVGGGLFWFAAISAAFLLWMSEEEKEARPSGTLRRDLTVKPDRRPATRES